MSRSRRIALVALVPALVLVLGLAGCSKAAPPSSADSTAAPAEAMTVKFVSPTPGSEVAAGELKVEVATTGLKFVMPDNKPTPGEGHVHFTLDDRPYVMSIEKSAVIKDVTPGPHKLVAELVQNDISSFDPPVEVEIEFVAK